MTGYEIVTAFSPSGPSALASAQATCSSGKHVIGGGASIGGLINNVSSGDGTGPHLYQSAPSGQTGWTAAAVASQAYVGSFGITVFAICVDN
jgi:hypothetical protein